MGEGTKEFGLRACLYLLNKKSSAADLRHNFQAQFGNVSAKTIYRYLILLEGRNLVSKTPDKDDPRVHYWKAK